MAGFSRTEWIEKECVPVEKIHGIGCTEICSVCPYSVIDSYGRLKCDPNDLEELCAIYKKNNLEKKEDDKDIRIKELEGQVATLKREIACLKALI